MELFKEIIEKKLEKKSFCELRRLYVRAFWDHLQVYTLAVVILGIEVSKKDIRRRNNVYKKMLIKGSVNQSDIRKMSKIINADFRIINNSVELITKINESTFASYGSFYQPGRVAVDMDEYPID